MFRGATELFREKVAQGEEAGKVQFLNLLKIEHEPFLFRCPRKYADGFKNLTKSDQVVGAEVVFFNTRIEGVMIKYLYHAGQEKPEISICIAPDS